MPSPLYQAYRQPVLRRGEMLRRQEVRAYGYPVKSSQDLGLDEYFKGRPDVAGMAWGGGENGSDPSEPRSVVHNPYNPYMGDKQKRDALYKLEAARHLMRSTPVPKFNITPKLKAWREKSFKPGDPYRDNDDLFRETVVSRMIVGDTGVDGDMPLERDPGAVAAQIQQRLNAEAPKNPFTQIDRRARWFDHKP